MNARMSVQRKKRTNIESAPQAPMHDEAHTTAEAPQIVEEALQSGGQPLDEQTRAFMEPRFGHDFSRVRVHTDDRAAASAEAVGALAYTVGQDIVFGAGRYAPGSAEGQRLLAHELTHVVQQGPRLEVKLHPAEGTCTTAPSDGFELAANDMAANVAHNPSQGIKSDHRSAGVAPVSIQRQVAGPPAAEGTPRPGDPRLLLSGAQAAEAVAKILPTARAIIVSSSFGTVELTPGTIWDGDKMLIYAEPMTVYYTIGNHLYEVSASGFIRDQWFGALSRGAAHAKGMIILAETEAALLEGLFVPWQLMLGMSVAKLGLFYVSHKALVNTAINEIPTALRLTLEFQQRYPTLFAKMAKTVGKEVWQNLPSGVRAEDVAFFLGRVLRNVAALPEVTFGSIIWVVSEIAALVGLIHLPSIAAHGIEEAAKTKAAEIRESMAQLGMSLSEEEARIMLRELLARGDTVEKLRELQMAMKDLAPVLQALASILHAEE